MSPKKARKLVRAWKRGDLLTETLKYKEWKRLSSSLIDLKDVVLPLKKNLCVNP